MQKHNNNRGSSTRRQTKIKIKKRTYTLDFQHKFKCKMQKRKFENELFWASAILQNKSAKWHCGRHTLICICKKILIKKT